MPPKTDRSRPITWRDVVPVVAFAAALLLTFWTRQYSDLPPNSLPAHWNIHHRAASYQRSTNLSPTAVRSEDT